VFAKKIRLFKVFGFEVGIDPSWVVLAILVAWSLSMGFFPAQYQDLSTGMYWFMGIVGTVGLFFSIVLHEMCHSLVARRYGIGMRGITLFMFGGVAEMGEEPPGPRAEFMMAVAGPLSSVAIGLIFYGVYLLVLNTRQPVPVAGILMYLAMINGLLAAFNLVPAFPLDGGRMLRSALWGWKKDLRWATRIASRIGSSFGILLIVLGVFQFFGGNFIGGMWWFLIGMFLRGAARSSYEQLLLRRALEGEPVERFMNTDPVTVNRSVSVDDLVEDYIYKYHYKMFPVVENTGRLVGCVTTKQVKDVPREEWKRKKVEEISAPCSEENVIDPRVDAMKALSLMTKTGASRLLVATGDHLVGVLALKDMLKFLSVKVELEET
jgi:Zn-dependent protease/CBS domain-containing protein